MSLQYNLSIPYTYDLTILVPDKIEVWRIGTKTKSNDGRDFVHSVLFGNFIEQ